MKGIVFTEFLEMVEETFGYKMVDRLLIENDLKSSGIYTSILIYDRQEMLLLLSDLSKKTAMPVPVLLYFFGQHLFKAYKKGFPAFFEAAPNAFSFLDDIKGQIDLEMEKISKKAQNAKLNTKKEDINTLEKTCFSDGEIAEFALFQIEKAFKYYGEKVRFLKGNNNYIETHSANCA